MDLEVPHFHHELVYEAIVMVIESSHEKTEEAMCKLLQSLFRSFVISIENLRAGFQRCYDQMVDISIDVPQAYNILERWVLRCRQVRRVAIILEKTNWNWILVLRDLLRTLNFHLLMNPHFRPESSMMTL